MGKKYEIIITDNNSTDGSQKMINTFKKNIHIIQNSRNEGYTSALNKAILKTTGKYIVILNPDTILENRSIINLISSFEKDSAIAVSLNKVPEIPSIKIKGRKTAIKISVVAIIAKEICLEPLYAATKGDSPFSILL